MSLNHTPSDIPIAEISGTVVHGKGLGHTVGMPTANLLPDRSMEIPAEGVYASKVYLPEGVFIGVTNIGERPTVDNDRRFTIETNIHAFDKDIYGERMTLEVIYFLRSIQRMRSLEEVRDQVRKDMGRAIELLTE